jgi:hypothetical protein
MADEPDRTPTEAMGQRREVFRPMLGNIIAGFIISGLLVAGGLAMIGGPTLKAAGRDWDLPNYDAHGLAWLWLVLFWVIGLGLVAAGVALARYAQGLISHRVEVWTDGFQFWKRGSADEVRWTAVRLVRETIQYERPPILKGPAKLVLPKLASWSYSVIADTGTSYEFDGNSIKAIKQFGRLLRERAEANGVPWEQVEVHT